MGKLYLMKIFHEEIFSNAINYVGGIINELSVSKKSGIDLKSILRIQILCFLRSITLIIEKSRQLKNQKSS